MLARIIKFRTIEDEDVVLSDNVMKCAIMKIYDWLFLLRISEY